MVQSTVAAWSNSQQRRCVFQIQLPLHLAIAGAEYAQSRRLRKAIGGDWAVTQFIGVCDERVSAA
jgi:hypothetical protein